MEITAMKNDVALTNDVSFWTGFYKNDDPITWASNKAYLDMNRTMTFRESDSGKTEKEKRAIQEKRNGWRDGVTNTIIRKRINELEKCDDFDQWHEETCKEMIDFYSNNKEENGQSVLVCREGKKRTDKETTLLPGQAQKWLNMTLKYLWLLYRLKLLEDNLSSFVCKHQSYFHIPLDSYIIRYIKREPKQKRMNDFPESNGLNNMYSIVGLSGSEWSKINDYKEYLEYQKTIRNDLSKSKMLPLQWELEHWHKALIYYG